MWPWNTRASRLEYLPYSCPGIDRRFAGTFRVGLGLSVGLRTGIVGRVHQRNDRGRERGRRLARAAREGFGFRGRLG